MTGRASKTFLLQKELREWLGAGFTERFLRRQANEHLTGVRIGERLCAIFSAPWSSYAPPCSHCNTQGGHTKTCKLRPLDKIEAIGKCSDCGCEDGLHNTWCRHWIAYEKRDNR